MLTKRIIPCLDVDKGRVVKGVKFFDHVDAGDPVEQARRYEQQGADELVFYDITASHEGREIMADWVRKVVEQVINSAAVKNPKLLAEISRKFGCCATVLGLDANRVKKDDIETWEVFVAGGRVATGIGVMDWVRQAEELGAGEIVLNVMNADGTTAGYDLEMTAAVSDAVKIPVVASGGAGSPEHIRSVLQEGHADAALAASIFHFNQYTVGDVKRYLAEAGVAVRLV
jgi:cyclase